MALLLFAKGKSLALSGRKGFATLLAIMAIFAIGTVAAVFSLSLAIGSSHFAVDLVQSKKAQALADQCAELAARKIKDSPDYTGTESFSHEWGECGYSVASETADGVITWQIDALGTNGGAQRKVRAEYSATIPPEPDPPVPLLDLWREVADFD